MYLKKNIKHIQISRDSSLVVNWMKGNAQFHDIILKPVGDQLKVTPTFEKNILLIVFRELNEENDALLKKNNFSIYVEKIKDEIIVSFVFSLLKNI
jgi:hypothetical protein